MEVVNDNLRKYYDYLVTAKADVPSTYESFSSTLSDDASAKQYYQYLKTSKFDAPDTYESFSETLGLKKKVASEYSYPTSKAFTESTPEDNGSVAKDEATTPQQIGALEVPKETPIEKPKEEVVKPSVYDEGYSALTDATIKGTHPDGEPVTAENYITAAPQAFNKRFGEAIRNVGELANLPQNTMDYYIQKIGGKNGSAIVNYMRHALGSLPIIGMLSKDNVDKIASTVENAGNPKAIPKDIGGSLLSTLGSVAFDIMTVRAMPTSKLNVLAKYDMARVPMFPTYLATMQGATTARGGDDVKKTAVATAEGLASGLTYEGMGITAGRFGEMVQKLAGGRVGKAFVDGVIKETVTGKQLAKTSASALANSALFEGDSRIKGGEKWTGAITGFIFSAPEFKQDVTNIVKQSVAKRAYVSYLTTTDNAIRNISKMNLDPIELRTKSDELWEEYLKEKDGEKGTDLYNEKIVIDNMINVNAVTQAIIENPTAFLNEINKDVRLSDAEKAKWVDKIKKTVNFADPRIDEAMPIYDKIKELKQSVTDAETLYPDENIRKEKIIVIEEQIKEQEKLASKTLGRPLGAQPKYEMSGNPIEKDEALNLIKQAENVEDLEGLKIQNDSAVEKALEDKFGEEAMAKKAEEIKKSETAPKEEKIVTKGKPIPAIPEGFIPEVQRRKSGKDKVLIRTPEGQEASSITFKTVDVEGKKYWSIQQSVTAKGHEEKGLSQNTYKYAMENLPEGYEGILSPKETRQNDTQIPHILDKLGKIYDSSTAENGDITFKPKAEVKDEPAKVENKPVEPIVDEVVPETVKDETVKAVTKKLDKQSAIKEDKIFKEQKNKLLDDLISAEDILLGKNKDNARKLEESDVDQATKDSNIKDLYQHDLSTLPKEAVAKLNKLGIKVKDGKLVVDIYKDGTVEVGDIRSALRIIDKGFPTRIKEVRMPSGPGKPSKTQMRNTAESYGSLKESERRVQLAEENLATANKSTNKGLQKTMAEQLAEVKAIHEEAKNVDYTRLEKEAKMSSDKEFKALWEKHQDDFQYGNTHREQLFDIIERQGRPKDLTYDNVQPLVIKDRLETEKKTIEEKRRELEKELTKLDFEKRDKFGRKDGAGFKQPKNKNEEWQLRTIDNQIKKGQSDLSDLEKYEPAIKKLNEKTETAKQPDITIGKGEENIVSGGTEAGDKPAKAEGKTEPISAGEPEKVEPAKVEQPKEGVPELVSGSHFTNSKGEKFIDGESVSYNGEKAKLSIPEGLAPGLSKDGGVKPMTIAEMDKMQKISPADAKKPPTKEELLKVREQDIKGKIANNLEDLMSSLGGISKITEEQRPGVVKSLVALMNNLGDLTLLKGEQLWERVKQELKSKNISIPDDLFKEAQSTYTKGREGETGDEKYRKTQVNALIQDRTLQQQTVAEIVNANKEKYTVLHGEDAIAQAKKMIDEQGVANATSDLKERTRHMDEFPIRQVARQVLLDFYSRAIIDKNATEVDKEIAFKAIDDLQQITAREATKAGQGSAMLQIWKSMQPAGLLEYVKRKIEQGNKRILDKKIGDTTVGKQIDELYNTLTEESKKIIDDILAGKKLSIAKEGVKRSPTPSMKKSVPKERIQQEQDYRRTLLDDYKKKEKTTSASIAFLTKDQIELGGNLLGSYVREGYYRTKGIIEKLTKDFKDIGIDLDQKQINEILAQKRDEKGSYREYLTQEEAATGVKKETGSHIDEIIKKHWTEKDELKRTLAQKLVDEAGLTEGDAKRLETAILAEFDKQILERSQKHLTKILGTEKMPVDKKKATLMDKMVGLLNMGALDEGLYRDLFAEKFNLTKLTNEHSAEILRLANNVQESSKKGWLERDATIKLAKYIYELYPIKKSSEIMDTWIAMAYSNMLSGPFTSVLNLWSAGSNMIIKPIRDVTNLSKWLKLVKSGVKGEGDVYNPFGEMVYSPMLRGVSHGWTEAKEVYINGDLNNKYMEEIAKKNQFKVTQLERNKYGDAKRFKPITIKIGDKSFDLNPFNAYKYAGRNLAAQDKMMLTTSYEMELAHILRDKLKNKNLTGRALTREVMAVFNGEHIDMDKLNTTLDSDVALYKKLTGEDMTPLQIKIRKRELMFEQLPVTKEEKAEAEALARGNIFTDDRGGLFATIAQGIGSMANSSPAAGLIIKPFVPFTKVVGNVTEYMMDHTPFYGLLRANGYGVVSMIKNRINPELPTAQMGDRGSRAYYEQMGRAWFGTLAFSTAMALLLGKDEKDFAEISGGYAQEGFKKGGREKVLPPYTLRIGSVMIPYKNIPSLAIPFALIGNLNDGLKSKQDEGDLKERLTASLLLDATANSVLMIKDMSFLDGVQRGTQIIADAASGDEKKWAKIGTGIIKSYVGFVTRPLPQNNNAVQQIWKIFDPTSYSQKEIKDLLAYSAGIQHFVSRPNLDQFGDVVKTYPGETLLPYTHWLGIKEQDPRWQFLTTHNAIPNKLYNKTMLIETGDGLQKRQMEADELFDYTKRTGTLFSESLKKYMDDNTKVDKRSKEFTERAKANGDLEKISGVREDLEKIWSKATDDAELELFRWGTVKEEMPVAWDLIKKNQAYQQYQTSKETGDYKWTKSELYEFNNLASKRYADRIDSYLASGSAERDKKHIEKSGNSKFQERIDKEWVDARKYIGDRMDHQIKAKIREIRTSKNK